MEVIVPDASVILKWALPSDDEPGADRALLLRDAIRDDLVRAIVPGLWLYEVGNTITRRFPEHADRWLSALLKLGLEEAPVSRSWLERVVELTARYPVSFYDAAYHATALHYSGVFVTADQRYLGLAAAHGSIVALSAWTTPQRPPPRRRR